MSSVKFQCPSYKLFEPEYHPQKPIIVGVDDRLESPETVALRYEEAARAAEGGDTRGDSPRLLEMATYSKSQLPSVHGYDPSRYQDASYEQYSQSFPDQQAEKFAQLNQQSFASNHNGVAQYMPQGPAVLSCQPSSGITGTKVFLKDVARESPDSNGFVYSCSAEAPQLLVTGSSSPSVPLSLLIQGPAGDEISRTAAGAFQYLEGSGDDITRATKLSRHETGAPGPEIDQPDASSKLDQPSSLSTDPTTNTYDYPGQQGQYGNAIAQGTTDMITAYRSSSFTDPHFHHRRAAPAWSPFGSTTLGSTGRGPLLDHTGMGRPSLTPLPMTSSSVGGHGSTPQLVRTSTISSSPGGNSSYPSMSMYTAKAILKVNGKLDSMADNWTQEEWDNRRRIVLFRRSQSGSTVHANFKPVPVSERPPNSVCISCIWWAEKGECYVTSVDTIYLLEQLVAAPGRFTVEEKNRIRRNLEGFHPLTVSKAKADSEDFFKLIMGFPNPKPRNIEKDVKVFPWKSLEASLKKIISKYSANPSTTLPPANMMTPVSATPYATLPTPPGHGLAGQQSLPSVHGDSHSQSHGQYSVHSGHIDSMPSPRSVSGSHSSSWAPYSSGPSGYSTAATRTLSPSIRIPSPQQPSSMRINTNPLPAVTTYDTRTVSSGGYASTGLHTPLSHHPSTATPPRWESTAASYPDTYSSLSSHHNPASQSVYGPAAYHDGAPRA